ncbi:unnamed protein product [Symbiodinium natans]|uniref:Uncharacterized protein n=1 Tax=Symbiodinium natans TaxID=878477 RepID=A0A812LCC2_9DINO|nr:unnamed protein product [Symbiodinium natans]
MRRKPAQWTTPTAYPIHFPIFYGVRPIGAVAEASLDGNAYLRANFPKLTYIQQARCLDWPQAPVQGVAGGPTAADRVQERPGPVEQAAPGPAYGACGPAIGMPFEDNPGSAMAGGASLPMGRGPAAGATGPAVMNGQPRMQQPNSGTSAVTISTLPGQTLPPSGCTAAARPATMQPAPMLGHVPIAAYNPMVQQSFEQQAHQQVQMLLTKAAAMKPEAAPVTTCSSVQLVPTATGRSGSYVPPPVFTTSGSYVPPPVFSASGSYVPPPAMASTTGSWVPPPRPLAPLTAPMSPLLPGMGPPLGQPLGQTMAQTTGAPLPGGSTVPPMSLGHCGAPGSATVPAMSLGQCGGQGSAIPIPPMSLGQCGGQGPGHPSPFATPFPGGAHPGSLQTGAAPTSILQQGLGGPGYGGSLQATSVSSLCGGCGMPPVPGLEGNPWNFRGLQVPQLPMPTLQAPVMPGPGLGLPVRPDATQRIDMPPPGAFPAPFGSPGLAAGGLPSPARP